MTDIEWLRRVYPPGARVRLVGHNDPYSDLAPGTEGTVRRVDSLGTIHVDWDNGSQLGMIPEAGDAIEPLADPDKAS